MGTNVEFQFEMGASVKVRDLGIKGRVVGLMVDRDILRWALVERLRAGEEIEREWFRETDLSG